MPARLRFSRGEARRATTLLVECALLLRKVSGMWLDRRDASGVRSPDHAQTRTAAMCIAIYVAAEALARLLLRDTAWPAWLTLAIDAGLLLFLRLGERWARTLFIIRIVLGLTAWPGWWYGKDFLALAVNASSGVSYLIALWGGQHHRLRYLAYALAVMAAGLVLLDAL